MRKYVVALFCDLCEHSDAWNRIPEDKMAGLVGEYKALAEKVASQYGSFHNNFVGDAHLVLFENADAAVRFGLRLISTWHEEFARSRALEGLEPIPLRVGAHFGEDTEMAGGGAWIGRPNNLAKRVQEAAKPDTVFVSEGILDLIDIALYKFQRICARKLKGDCVARRTLYRVAGFDEGASAAKPSDELTPEDWLLRAAAMVGTAKENTEEEEACYVEALRLRPDYAEAHNAYGVLLQQRGDAEGAEEHYLEVLRLRPDAPVIHSNYGVLLQERGDAKGAEEHHLEALRLRPDDAQAHYNYAILLKETGDVKGAEEHYLQALRLRPEYDKAHYNYAILLAGRGDAEGAEEHYRRAYELDPSDPDYKSAFQSRAWER